MNEDFILPASPAMARRLCRLADALEMDFDPALVELAAHDRIPVPHWPEIESVAQDITDCNFRTGVFYDDFDDVVKVIHSAVMQRGFEKVVLFTNLDYGDDVEEMTSEVELPNGKTFSALYSSNPNEFLKNVSVRNYETTLIVCHTCASKRIDGVEALKREFPHVLVFLPYGRFVRLGDGLLGTPIEKATAKPEHAADRLAPRNFKKFNLVDLSQFVGFNGDLVKAHRELCNEFDENTRKTYNRRLGAAHRVRALELSSYPERYFG